MILHKPFIGTFFIAVYILCFLFTPAFANQETHPFIKIKQAIKTLNAVAAEYEGESKYTCRPVYGHRLELYYKQHFTPQAQRLDDLELQENSTSFREESRIIDEEIQKAVQTFAKSDAACSWQEFNTAQRQLYYIYILREDLYKQSKTHTQLEKESNPSKDEADSRSFIMKESKELLQEFFTKIRHIDAAIKDLKNESKSNAWEKYSWSLEKKERENIQKRANNRAQEYVQDFYTTLLGGGYTPLHREKTQIISSLGRLPDGASERSRYNWSWDDAKNEEANNKVNDQILERIETLNSKRNEFLFQDIQVKNTIEENVSRYSKNLLRLMQNEETFLQFDSSLSQSVVDSLDPFHQTLIETEALLRYQEDALEAVIQRQNIGAGGR